MSEVEKVCQRVGVVQNGKLVAIENVEEIGQKKVRYMEVSFLKKYQQKSLTFQKLRYWNTTIFTTVFQ
ncbi:MAG: hypothetical protein DDT22_00451 [candidate division WS2 bacterium]|nr:hypothetical protein [Candidatus Lithacetigena glycinireducens]